MTDRDREEINSTLELLLAEVSKLKTRVAELENATGVGK